MAENFDLDAYMTRGVEDLVKTAMKSTLKNPRESLYLAQFAVSSRRANEKRRKAELAGEHVPTFLICSITEKCNLHCEGCYAWANEHCGTEETKNPLSAEQWADIFAQARELGVGFILLAGGEPLMRMDVIREAARVPEILFPVFTNGVLLSGDRLDLFDKHRNLLPVFSIEGGAEATDRRRGAGMYNILIKSMDRIHEKGLVFGASMTVTKKNLGEVTSDTFIDELAKRDCKALFFVEYTPIDEQSEALALDDDDRALLEARIGALREKRQDMLYFSFPGDEKFTGGCLAAGRGFFHINATGGAEPCPFSPYSDTNVAETSLKESLHSRLFTELHDGGLLAEEHIGGCALFKQKAKIEEILGSTK